MSSVWNHTKQLILICPHKYSILYLSKYIKKIKPFQIKYWKAVEYPG